jgi:hypothetical protein
MSLVGKSFKEQLEKLTQMQATKTTLGDSPFLFRGQASDIWHLTTTLERYKKKDSASASITGSSRRQSHKSRLSLD